MKVIYIVGPYRASNAWEIEQNIRLAEWRALQVWLTGNATICPHANTRFFQGIASDSLRLSGDLEILKRCDAVLIVDGSIQESSSSWKELEAAKESGIPVFHNFSCLIAWLVAENSYEPVGTMVRMSDGFRVFGKIKED